MTTFTVPTIFTAVDRFSPTMARMERQARSFSGRMQNISQKAANVAQKSALVGAVVAAPLVLAAKTAIDFEDRMADVAKTTGLSGKELELLGKDIRNLSNDTRTPIEGLQKISEIAGQMGIKGRQNVIDFTDSVNKFNVALGGDFQGGLEEASRAVGGLNLLFKETRNLKVAESITRIGSSINALSAKGVLVPEVTEFIKRIGQLPDAIKPTITDTAALGAVFNKAGITAEIASRAVGDVLITAAQNAPAFAKQMGMSTKAVQDLLNTNPTEFLKQFSSTLKGVKATEFAKLSKNLKLGDVGAIKVVGTLASSMEKLTEFQKISNDEFALGTSLMNEYNIKNDTAAAKLAKFKNQITNLGIEAGNVLIPVLSDLLKELTPLIKSFGEWVKNNPETFRTIIKTAAAFAALSFAISGVSSVISIVTKSLAILSANPIILIIGAIVILIGLLIDMMGNWEMIKKAFTDGGIVAGIKAIGAALYDLVLQPTQDLLLALAKIPGLGGLGGVADELAKYRFSLGLTSGIETGYLNNMTRARGVAPGSGFMLPAFNPSAGSFTSPDGTSRLQGKDIFGDLFSSARTKDAINPEAEKQKAITNTILEKQQQNVNMTIDNNTGYKANVWSEGGIPINLNQSLKLR